ncbi:hypothetical protein ACFSQT_31290 [Mesorhizobium calcicola]|uniref:Transposase n=1 Tax=Mesorhizobium calcicola TaxID=1300310 RepID=A0ABW4WN00_9HYPH
MPTRSYILAVGARAVPNRTLAALDEAGLARQVENRARSTCRTILQAVVAGKMEWASSPSITPWAISPFAHVRSVI